MNPSTVDALANFEQWLSDALKDAQRARLEFEARLATALAEERIEPENKRAQADQLAEEVAEIARKFTDEAAKVARKRVPPLRRPQTSYARADLCAAPGGRSGGRGESNGASRRH